MPSPKPFVGAAFICEHVLREEGNVYSAIRIVDTYTATLIPVGTPRPVSDLEGSEQVKVVDVSQILNMSAFVMVKAGAVTGPHDMSLVIRNPDGKETRYPQKFKVDFVSADPAEGAAMTIQFVMPGNSKAGLYWIDVLWDEELLTSIPLKLVRKQTA